MRLLLDTPVLLWALAGSPKIKRISARLLNDDNQVFFSVASLWEVAIKSGIGKLDANVVEVRRAARESGYEELAVLGKHIEALDGLPDHHRDPFDRLLVAQAIAEPMQLLTADGTVVLYGAHVEMI
ncbi:MAG: type II toxin-antitoxin system VapC family toxin [Pseudomonadota bacterium]